MMEIPASNLSEILKQDPSRTLLISAPNYEPRSTLPSAIPIQMLASDAWPGQLLVIQIASPERRVEALEGLNRINAASLDELTQRRSRNLTVHRVRYPYVDNRVQHELERALRPLRRPYRIVIDMTALPRTVIADFMEFIQTQAEHIERLFLIYTWAGGYPHATNPTATGDLSGIREKSSLHKLIARTRKPAALVFLGRQGFDAQQVADAFHECGERISVAALFDGDDPLLSLDVLRANANLLSDRNVDTQYYFNLEQGCNLIDTWANDCISEGHDALFIAPFGPKPLVAWSWLHLSKLSIMWDILLLKESTILTTYSIGRGRTSLFELTSQDLPKSTKATG